MRQPRRHLGTEYAGTPSIHRSFVVRLYAEQGSTDDRLFGLVEHLISGRAAEFSSVDELVRFMRSVVTTECREHS